MLEEGEAAPFTGQLLTNELAIHLGQLAESCPREIAIAVGAVTASAAVHRRADRQICASNLRAAEGKLKLWEERALAAESWVRHPALWATIGAGLALLAVWVGVEVVKAARARFNFE